MPRVSIQDTDKTFEVENGEILYDALLERGEALPHGCLSGSCGACRIEITSGKDHAEPPGIVENDTISALKEEFSQVRGAEFIDGKEIRLSCRLKIRGDLSFKVIK